MHRRFCKIAEAYGLTDDDLDLIEKNLTVYAGRAFPLVRPEDGTVMPTAHYNQWLKQEVRRLQPGLIVIDPMIHFFGGDENSNVHVGNFMVWLQRLTALVSDGAAVWVNHHTSKHRQDENTSAAGRGASAGRDAQRALFGLAPLSNEEVRTFGISSRHLFVKLEMTKANWTERLGGPVYLQREVGKLGGVLRQVDMSARKVETQNAVVEHMARELGEVLGDNPEDLSVRNVTHDPGGKEIRDYMSGKFGRWATRDRLVEAIEIAERQGILRIDVVRSKGAPKRVPRQNTDSWSFMAVVGG